MRQGASLRLGLLNPEDPMNLLSRYNLLHIIFYQNIFFCQIKCCFYKMLIYQGIIGKYIDFTVYICYYLRVYEKYLDYVGLGSSRYCGMPGIPKNE